MASVGREEAAASTAAASSSPTAASDAVSGQGTSERRQAEAPAAGSAASPRSEQLDETTKLKMRAYRNLRYHSDRQSHYERLTRYTNFMLVLLGSGSFALTFAKESVWTAIGTIAVTIIASAQLVFDLSRRAKEEDVLKLECAKLVADAEDPGVDVAKMEAAMATLYGRELETYHAVNALAYNATQIAFGRPQSTLIQVSAWQKWLRHWRVYTAADFPDQEPAAH